MLILTRRIGEGVIIGDGIRVVVLDIRGRQFRLGIDAPTDVVVLRDEIFQRLTQENHQAAMFSLDDLRALKEAVNGKFKPGFRPPDAPAEVPRLTIDSGKLGPIQVPENQIITFCQGLLGFNEFQRYVLLAPPEAAPFLILQGVDNPDLALVVTDPSGLVDKFPLNRIDSARGELKAQDSEDLQVLVPLTIPPEQPAAATANLVSPILINPKSRLGKQMVLESPLYSYRQRLLSE